MESRAVGPREKSSLHRHHNSRLELALPAAAAAGRHSQLGRQGSGVDVHDTMEEEPSRKRRAQEQQHRELDDIGTGEAAAGELQQVRCRHGLII
jgi:hypothetical protein